jgi:hypothetical protein
VLHIDTMKETCSVLFLTQRETINSAGHLNTQKIMEMSQIFQGKINMKISK